MNMDLIDGQRDTLGGVLDGLRLFLEHDCAGLGEYGFCGGYQGSGDRREDGSKISTIELLCGCQEGAVR